MSGTRKPGVTLLAVFLIGYGAVGVPIGLAAAVVGADAIEIGISLLGGTVCACAGTAGILLWRRSGHAGLWLLALAVGLAIFNGVEIVPRIREGDDTWPLAVVVWALLAPVLWFGYRFIRRECEADQRGLDPDD